MKTKMHFPKNDKQELALVQHFLVLQIFLPLGTPFSLEIVVSDTTKVQDLTQSIIICIIE